MITLGKVRSSIIKAGKRILKIEEYGVKTALEVSSFGDDSNPVENLSAVYAKTGENGEPVIIGYINENQLAAIGEKRLYSLKPDKTLAAHIWLKNNGDIQLNGTVDNAVRYQKLDDALQLEVQKINAELVKVQTAIATVGGVYARTPIDINTSAAKIEEVKTS